MTFVKKTRRVDKSFFVINALFGLLGALTRSANFSADPGRRPSMPPDGGKRGDVKRSEAA
jgi:hypothetical protein